jgi:hypothetical protein
MLNPKHTMSELCSTSNTQCRNNVQPQTHNVGTMFNTNIQCRNYVQPQTHNVETMFNPKHVTSELCSTPSTKCPNCVQPQTHNVGTMLNPKHTMSELRFNPKHNVGTTFNPKHKMSEQCSTVKSVRAQFSLRTYCQNAVQPKTHTIHTKFNLSSQYRNWITSITYKTFVSFKKLGL